MISLKLSAGFWFNCLMLHYYLYKFLKVSYFLLLLLCQHWYLVLAILKILLLLSTKQLAFPFHFCLCSFIYILNIFSWVIVYKLYVGNEVYGVDGYIFISWFLVDLDSEFGMKISFT